MKSLFLGCIAILAVAACDSQRETDSSIPLIPDETPYIIAILEHSPDTLFHHPQVYVALATDQRDRSYSLLQDFENKPKEELWHPVAWAQVGLKLDRFKIQPVPYDAAEVSITGPLGTSDEQTIPFAFETRGVYGDAARALDVRPRGRYRLDVRLADGRRYRAETQVPTETQWALQDTTDIEISLTPVASGRPKIEYGRVQYDWVPPPITESNLSSYGTNATVEMDHAMFQLDASIGEAFPYEERNNQVRMGRQFGVFTTSHARTYTGETRPDLAWTRVAVDSLLTSMRLWPRLYSFNTELGLFYNSEDQYTEVINEDPWKEWNWNLADVVFDRDTTYFRRVSNIRSVDASGAPLGRDDAVGVFGAFVARYGTTVLRPIRDFDPCGHGWDCSAL